MATADAVQYHLEAIVPVLNEYQKLELFTPSQIKSIVKKCTNLEYSIAKRIPRKSDHLEYISYLMNLELLRAKRKARLGLRGHFKSDDALVSRIHSLFRKALQRFKGDISLWVQYLEYCKQIGSNTALSTWFAKAIQTFPTKELFWIMAANWEYERNSNMKSARVLMQRGLRMNPENQKMWLEYCKLELIYLQKLVDRQKILLKKDIVTEKSSSTDEGVVVPTSTDEETAKNVIAVEDETTLNADEEKEQENVLRKDTEAEKQKAWTAMQQTLAQQLVPRAIYRNAIKGIPNDIDFRIAFLELYKTMGIGSGQAAQDVLASLEKDFGTTPRVLDFLIRSQLTADEEDIDFPDQLKQVVSSYIDTLQKHSSSELVQLCVSFLSGLNLSDENLSLYTRAVTLKVLQLAESLSLADFDAYKMWISFDATVSERASQLYPQESIFWLKRVETLDGVDEKEHLLKEAVKAVPLEGERHLIWMAYVDFATTAFAYSPQKIHDIFNAALSMFELGGRDPEADLLERYVSWSVQHGQDTLHTTIQTLIASRQRPASFYKKCIDLESNFPAPSSHLLTKLWGLVTDVSPNDVEAWIGRIRYLMKEKMDLQSAGNVYWTATKVVSDRGYLDRRYAELTAGN